MKKTQVISVFLALVLVFVIVFRFAFFSSFMHLKKAEFRRSVINSEHIHILQVQMSTSELYKDKPGMEWKKNHKELVINGKYHEVICVTHTGSKALVTIIPDDKENELFSIYFENHENTGNSLCQLAGLLIGLHFEETDLENLYIFPSNTVCWLLRRPAGTLSGFLPSLTKPPLMNS